MKLGRIAAAVAIGVIGAWSVAVLWAPAVAGAGAVAAAGDPARPAAAGQLITRTVTLQPSKDNTLYETELGTVSNGAGDHFFAGTTNNSDIRRGLIAFDMHGIPPEATILSATLTLTMSKTSAGEAAVSLHALAADWGEGESDAVLEEGAGATAVAGDATWLHTFFNTDLWTTPGGDFAPAPSATTTVGGPGVYTWASPGLAADVAAWVANPGAAFGWALVGNESAVGTAKRFDSRENDPANRPRLTITYVAEEGERFVSYIPVVMGE